MQLETLALVRDGVRLGARAWGPSDGPVVVLLHGFPETSACWASLGAQLGRAGYRAIAPDQRGYAMSDAPTAIDAYAIEALVADAVAWIDAAGAPRAHLVGHDWGAVVAWMVANDAPDRVDRLVICNGPHPGALLAAWSRPSRQWLRSAYVAFFQLPALPEWLLTAGDFALWRWVLARDPLRPPSADEVDAAVAALAVKGLTGPLHYYRAARRRAAAVRARLRCVPAPTLVVWGTRDRYLGPALAVPPAAWASAVTVRWLPDASHWVLRDAPDAVADAVLAHLAPATAAGGGAAETGAGGESPASGPGLETTPGSDASSSPRSRRR